MHQKVKEIINKPLVQNVGIVAMGAAMAQATTMIFAPIITRVYGPEAFGTLGVFMSILTILAPITTLSYQAGIVLPSENEKAISLSRLSLLIAALTSIVTAFILFLFQMPLGEISTRGAMFPYLYLLPLAMFLAAWQQVSQQWLLRKGEYKFSSKVAIIHSLAVNGLKIGGGLINPLVIILVAVTTISGGLHALMLSLKLANETREIATFKLKQVWWQLKETAREYRDFPLYNAPQAFINAVSQGMPVIFLASLHNPAAAGFYTVSRMVMGLPSQLLGKSVGDVFFPWVARAWNDKSDVTRPLYKSTALMALAGLIPFGIIMITGPWLFKTVFGAEWEEAGSFATWMAIWFYFAFLNRPVVSIIPVIKIQKFFLSYEIGSVIIRSLSLLAGYLMVASALQVVAIFSITGALLNIYLLIHVLLKCRELSLLNKSKTHE